MKELKIPVEVYSRVVGYFRPVSQWNKGKQEEFKDRKTYENSLKGKKMNMLKKQYKDLKVGDLIIKKTTGEICEIKDLNFKYRTEPGFEHRVSYSKKEEDFNNWIWVFGAHYTINAVNRVFECFRGGLWVLVENEI